MIMAKTAGFKNSLFLMETVRKRNMAVDTATLRHENVWKNFYFLEKI